MTGGNLLAMGIFLLAVGLIILLVGASYLMSGPAMPAFTGNFQQDQQAGDAWFQASQAHAATGFGIFVVGTVLLAVGGWMIRFGAIRPVSSFVAAEATPAIETAAEAVGRGLDEAHAGKPSGFAPSVQTVVRVKCKNCGYLDSEDATYCSKCGKPL